MMKREPLYGKNLTELQGVCAELQLPRFVAKQIADWLYKKGVRSFEEMTNLSKAARTELSEKYEVGLHAPERVDSSADGTKKYLYRTAQDHFVESAYIPDRERATLCVSSQAGCRMGCRFCATARLGLKHSLSSCVKRFLVRLRTGNAFAVSIRGFASRVRYARSAVLR